MDKDAIDRILIKLKDALELLTAPSDSTSQLAGIIKTAIQTSLNQGQISLVEAASCNWICDNTIEAFRKPYILGWEAGMKAGKREALVENVFLKEFKDMMGYDWPTSTGDEK